MKFKGLQENLRKALLQRISRGELTGLGLAEQTGFKQAHISNFLNRKRSLSLEGMDRVLNVQRLSVLDLLDPEEVHERAPLVPSLREDEFENVFLVDGAVAATKPLILGTKAREIQKFNRSFLRSLRSRICGRRRDWARFVAIRAGSDALSMSPRLRPGATVLIDRHYNALRPYRPGEANLYAVYVSGACRIRYVERAGKNLVLRPHNRNYGIEIVPFEGKRATADCLVGRVCYVGQET